MKIRTYAGILLASIPGGVMAAGYYLPNQDAFATSRGNAFVATADSPAAVFYNPAGMTQLQGPEAQVGLYSIVLGNETNAGGVKSEAKNELQAVPNLYYVRPYNDRVSYGFSLNSPYGLGTDWGRDTPFSPVVTEARLMYISATSAIAYKVTDQLSLGASVSLNYADLKLEQGLGVPDSFLRFTGDDIGFSGSLSARWQPHEQHAFGLVYSTESKFDLEGETDTSVGGPPEDTSSSFDFMSPARIAGGYSFRPAPGWNIEANIEWLDWDSLNDLTLRSDTVGGSKAVEFDWESSFIYEIGVSYTTPEGYIYAIGYDFNESSQPDATYSPGVADADLQWLNLGFGRKCETYSWMLAYQFGYSNRVVDGGEGVNALANGKYQARHNALVLTWRQEF